MLLSNLLTLVKNRLNPFVTGRNRLLSHGPSHIFIPNIKHFAAFVAIVTKVPQQSSGDQGSGSGMVRHRLLASSLSRSAPLC